MLNIDRPPPSSRPPEAEGGMTIREATSTDDLTPGGAMCAVGAPHSRRSQLLTAARA